MSSSGISPEEHMIIALCTSVFIYGSYILLRVNDNRHKAEFNEALETNKKFSEILEQKREQGVEGILAYLKNSVDPVVLLKMVIIALSKYGFEIEPTLRSSVRGGKFRIGHRRAVFRVSHAEGKALARELKDFENHCYIHRKKGLFIHLELDCECKLEFSNYVEIIGDYRLLDLLSEKNIQPFGQDLLTMNKALNKKIRRVPPDN